MALYYAHSGRFKPAALVGALAVAAAAAIVMGAVYAYCDLYSPVDKLSVIITLLAAMGYAWILAFLLKKACVRNTPLALLTAFLSTTFFLYIAWHVWLFALLQRGNVHVPLWELFTHPADVWQLVLSVNEHGAWKLDKRVPTGGELWGFWTLEAGIFYGCALVIVHRAITKVPFCENCGTWGTARSLAQLNPGDAAIFRHQLEQKNFNAITTLGPFTRGVGTHYDISLQGCPTCDTTQTLCVDKVTVTVNKKGSVSRKTRHIVRRLLLTPEETVAVATAVSMLAPVAAAVPPAARSPTVS